MSTGESGDESDASRTSGETGHDTDDPTGSDSDSPSNSDPNPHSDSGSGSNSRSASNSESGSGASPGVGASDSAQIPEEVRRPTRRAAESAADLREEYDTLREIEQQLSRLGESRVETTVDAYRRANRVLDRYDDTATGSGDFASYVEFRSKFEAATSVDDALAADAFEQANDVVDQRRLNEGDFAEAREALSPAEQYLRLLEDRDAAVDTYRIRRNRTEGELDELDDHIDSLERTAEMADVDLSAPVADLEDVVTAYNDAVAEAFVQFKRSVSARDFFGFLDTCRRYPLVSVNQPPRELDEYVSARPAGTEPLPTLLEYADYSPGKLKHYVDDPGALRTTVAVHQTYLDRITVEPLTIGWPPPPATELRYLIRELIPLASRLTDHPEPVVALRDLRALTRTSRYDTLRRVALARDALPETAQQLIAAGAVEETLDHARTTRRLCERILAETTRE